MTEQRDPASIRSRSRDRSTVLLLAGTALLLPPLIGLVKDTGYVFGLPVPLVYVFTVWAALIAGAAALAAPLHDSSDGGSSESAVNSGD